MLAAMAAPTAARADAFSEAALLGRGINVLGYDPMWADPAKARFQPRDFARIRNGGFSHVRIPLIAFAHMDTANVLDPRWLLTLDRAVAQAQAAGLRVILDEHDHRFCGQDPAGCRTRLLAFWAQVAPRFRRAGDDVSFELLNEPSRALDAGAWNALLRDALGVVRASNPERVVLIGPANSNGFRSLDELRLPDDDRNILVTVHYYDPFVFTHQGARWTSPSRADDVGHGWGTDADRTAVSAAFDRIAAWGRAHDRPMHLGEFGAYDRAPTDARALWTAFVARTAEAHGIPWSYWQFDGDFLAFDRTRDDWVTPIHEALVPPP